MRGVVCNFFERVVDVRSQQWWRVEMDNSKNGVVEMDDPL